jgi:hypothetical protein
MVAKIKTLGQSSNSENVHRLEQHLERCFRLYRVPRIRPIVLETIAQLPKVADRLNLSFLLPNYMNIFKIFEIDYL